MVSLSKQKKLGFRTAVTLLRPSSYGRASWSLTWVKQSKTHEQIFCNHYVVPNM